MFGDSFGGKETNAARPPLKDYTFLEQLKLKRDELVDQLLQRHMQQQDPLLLTLPRGARRSIDPCDMACPFVEFQAPIGAGRFHLSSGNMHQNACGIGSQAGCTCRSSARDLGVHPHCLDVCSRRAGAPSQPQARTAHRCARHPLRQEAPRRAIQSITS